MGCFETFFVDNDFEKHPLLLDFFSNDVYGYRERFQWRASW